jgi:lactoylglutathione lyase
MAVKLGYVIESVEDMARAVKFYRDVVGLPLRFQSEGWSEFSTGETVLALHPDSEKNPSGRVELAFLADDLQKFYEEMTRRGVRFSMPPTKQGYGGMLGQFVDSEGALVSVGERS